MPSRRRFLASAATAAALAGCSSVLGDGNRVRWSQEFPDRWGVAPPLVATDGTVYAQFQDGWLSALDGESGTTRWQNRFRQSARTGPLVHLPTERLFVGSDDLVAVELDEESWQVDYWLEDPVAGGTDVSAMAARQDRLLVGTTDGSLLVVSQRDPRVLSTRSLSSADGAVVVGLWTTRGRTLALASTRFSGTVVAADPNGATAWEATFRAPFDAAVGEGTFYIAHAQSLSAVDSGDGTVRWSRSTGPYTGLTVAGGTVYAASDDPSPSLTALDATSGETTWETGLGGVTPRGVGPRVADGTVYVPETGADRLGAYTTDGERDWAHEFGRGVTIQTPPEYADGTVYLGVDSDVLALSA